MKIKGLASILLGLIPGGAMAAGFYLPNQDAFATARGNAFVATADNASAVFYNPAGMTQLQNPEAQLGLYSIVLGNEARMNGQTYEAETELQVAPSIYYVKPLNEKLTLGFGLNSPFGLGTDWGRENNFPGVATEARLLYSSATTAVAYKVTDTFSLGASVSLNYADLTLEQGLGFPGSFLRFEGDDFGVSGTLSARWQPSEQHAFGIIYSSESSFDLRGQTYSKGLPPDSSAGMDFMTPGRVAAGYSYRPAPGWNIEANIEWLNWNELNTLTLESGSVGGAMGVPFEWQSSFIYELGVSYTTPEGYVFAAGYDLNENSQPDANFSRGVADADRHWFNVGFGRRTECQSWMLAYQFGYSNRTVDGATNPFNNGEYESRHNALVLSWNRQF